MLPVDSMGLLGSIAGIARSRAKPSAAMMAPAARRPPGGIRALSHRPREASRDEPDPGRLRAARTVAWWIAGLVLLGLELLVPGNVLVWFGIAAMLTGLESSSWTSAGR